MMPRGFKQARDLALDLAADARAALAPDFLASLDGPPDADAAGRGERRSRSGSTSWSAAVRKRSTRTKP